MVSPSIGIRGAARWRIENHSLQRGRADLFQNRLPPNERSPDTGAILSIGHASAIGSSALAAAPLSLDSHSGTPKFPTLSRNDSRWRQRIGGWDDGKSQLGGFSV